jgi:hypothetical protein
LLVQEQEVRRRRLLVPQLNFLHFVHQPFKMQDVFARLRKGKLHLAFLSTSATPKYLLKASSSFLLSVIFIHLLRPAMKMQLTHLHTGQWHLSTTFV